MFDPKCLQLAIEFLEDSNLNENCSSDDWKRHTDDLAQEIQNTVEDYFKDNYLE